MGLLKDVSYKELNQFLISLGAKKSTQSGSHVKYVFPGYIGMVMVPTHHTIARGTLNEILNKISTMLNIPKLDLIRKLI